MVRTAASRSAAVRSGIFCVAMASSCARVNWPTLVVCGLALPFCKPIAFLIKTVAGGFLVQDRDIGRVARADLRIVTKKTPSDEQIRDMLRSAMGKALAEIDSFRDEVAKGIINALRDKDFW